MADAKITALTENTTPLGTDLVAIVDDPAGTPATQKMTINKLGWSIMKPGTDGEIPTFDASGNPAFVAVGTATHVLTSNGAGAAPTFQAAAGGGTDIFAKIIFTSTFESLGDNPGGTTMIWDSYKDGTAGVVRAATGQSGIYGLSTGATINSNVILRTLSPTAVDIDFSKNPKIGCKMVVDSNTATSWHFQAGAATFLPTTENHMGFRCVNGVLDATNGNGTTQTNTDISSGVTITNYNFYHCVKSSTTNITYYVGGTLKATHTTNLPTSTGRRSSWWLKNTEAADKDMGIIYWVTQDDMP